MTANPFAALPRYSLIDGNMTRATSGDYVHVSDLAALAAAVPDDLADAGTVAEECFAAVNGEGKRACDWADKPHRLVYDLCRTIRALIALAIAQAAQIAGLDAENHSVNDLLTFHTNRAITSEQQVAALRAEAKRLREAAKALEKAASEVSRRGAETGPQWSKLTIAILQTRAALGGKHE